MSRSVLEFVREFLPRRLMPAGARVPRSTPDKLADLPLRDPVKRETSLRVLLIADRVQATQSISFLRPLARKREKHSCAIWAIDEPTVVEHGDRVSQFLTRVLDGLAPNVICLTRYSGPHPDLMLRMARERRVATIGHLDDDLFNVPDSHGPCKVRFYHDPRRQENLRRAMAGCDLIYASTGQLAEAIRARNLGNPVIGGGIYCSADERYLANRRPGRNDSQIIGYMGTRGHEVDLAIPTPAIVKLLETRPNLSFEIFGSVGIPESLRRFDGRVTHIPAEGSYDGFLDKLATLIWDIGLAPLKNSPFNACKADTKWVEYSSSAIPVAASDIPVYRPAADGGAAILVPDDDWEDTLTWLLESPEQRADLVACAQYKLTREYSVRALEKQLLGVFREVGVRW